MASSRRRTLSLGLALLSGACLASGGAQCGDDVAECTYWAEMGGAPPSVACRRGAPIPHGERAANAMRAAPTATRPVRAIIGLRSASAKRVSTSCPRLRRSRRARESAAPLSSAATQIPPS
eukprot:5152508-Prymnesium_polylepis.1